MVKKNLVRINSKCSCNHNSTSSLNLCCDYESSDSSNAQKTHCINWIALSVGGSLLNDGKPNTNMAKKLAKIFLSTNKNLAIVVGGGKQARLEAQKAREKYDSEYEADMSAIKITLKNARVLRTALGKNAGEDICLNFEDAKKCAKNQKFIVMGGMIPGITTDADCAILAEALGAKTLINFSKTAIYDSDPTKNPNAKKYDTLSYEQLISLANKSDKRLAGTNFIFDMLACNIIARSKIHAHFIDGSDEKEVINAIMGRPHGGTVVG